MGAGAIRKVCQQGFEAMRGEFRWVIVRGDIAVTWGLNHMQAQEPGQEKVESWFGSSTVAAKAGLSSSGSAPA